MPLLRGLANQNLEQRSYLTLEFPNQEIRRVPFFENPKITESKKANYTKLFPFGRSSPILTYFNSDSRQISLSFSLNLDHIASVFSKDLYTLTFPYSVASKGKLSRKDFFTRLKSNDSAVENKGYSARDLDLDFQERVADVNNADVNVSIDSLIVEAQRDRRLKTRVIDYIIYWINLIRATTLNNNLDPRLGPPIVRLTHGILFMYVPFVCFGYKIEFDEVAGYDRETLLPRKVDISLELVEVRHGDFGEYKSGVAVKRDNVCGWEAIIDSKYPNKTIDPLPIYKLTGGLNDS